MLLACLFSYRAGRERGRRDRIEELEGKFIELENHFIGRVYDIEK